MSIVPGWVEIDDPLGRGIRHFEATYAIGRRKPQRVEVASLKPSDEACIAKILDVQKSVEAEGGRIVGTS